MRIHDIRTSADLKRYYIENGLHSIERQIKALKEIMGVRAVIQSVPLNPAELLSCLEQEFLEIWDRRDRSLHKPVSEWTDEDAEKIRKIAANQNRELLGVRDAVVTCGSCGNPVRLWQAFRCYYCGVWFCNSCGAEHFGGARPASFHDAADSPF